MCLAWKSVAYPLALAGIPHDHSPRSWANPFREGSLFIFAVHGSANAVLLCRLARHP